MEKGGWHPRLISQPEHPVETYRRKNPIPWLQQWEIQKWPLFSVSLSVQFWMLTLWAYTRFAQGRSRAGCRVPGAGDSSLALGSRPSTFDYYLALAFFALGLMSKPMMVTLPCVLLVLDYWPLGRWQQKNRRGLLVEKAPFFLLSAIVSVVTYSTQKNADMMSNVLTGLSLSFSARLENALVSYGRYLGKLFWPVDLCVLYPYPDHWPMQKILFAGLLVLGLSVLVFVMRRQRPYLLTGWLWYLGTLVPVLGLVPVGAKPWLIATVIFRPLGY